MTAPAASPLALPQRHRRSLLAVLAPHLPLITTAVVAAVLYLGGCLRYNGFSSGQVFVNFFGDNAFLGLTAVGMTFVILTGGIDLSVGAIIAFTSVLLGSLVENHHVPPALAIPLVLLAGCAIGLFNGAIIHLFDLAPFLVTLATMFLARGAAVLITLQTINIDNPAINKLTEIAPAVGPVNIGLPAIIFVVTLLIAAAVLRYTRFGRNVYALGGSEQSASLMGLPVGATKIAVYTLSGFCSALAGVVYVIYLPSGDPRAALGLELDSIAAVVIGGTLLTGGAGSMLGTLLGILIYGIIQSAINFEGDLSPSWTRIVVGLLLFLFILLQKLLTKLRPTRA